MTVRLFDRDMTDPNKKVLVVGTTCDYIDWIRQTRPGAALFLTDPDIRKKSKEPCPGNREEILCQITDIDAVQTALTTHLKICGIELAGIACFDCESMETASVLAARFGLPYPSLTAVKNCRDKYLCKQLWHEHQIPCPRTLPVKDITGVTAFLETAPQGLVLKPFCGSGSELVFKCRTRRECSTAFDTITTGLEERSANPLFRATDAGSYRMLAEEWIPGPEYSCDFLLENGKAVILRKTRKIKMDNRPFGTISGYALCTDANQGNHNDLAPNHHDGLAEILSKAAGALGIRTGICMVDFIIRGNTPVLIEMTPRPGGDCLPFLLKEAGNFDMLGMAIDAAAGIPWKHEKMVPYKPWVAYRIHARKEGILKRINTDALTGDKRVKKVHLIHAPGHMVTLPPKDYDSWLLGHMVIEPDRTTYLETECLLLSKRIEIEMELKLDKAC